MNMTLRRRHRQAWLTQNPSDALSDMMGKCANESEPERQAAILCRTTVRSLTLARMRRHKIQDSPGPELQVPRRGNLQHKPTQ